jgi:hypothetical protein
MSQVSALTLDREWGVVWNGIPPVDVTIVPPLEITALNVYPDSQAYYIEFPITDSYGVTSMIRAVVPGSQLDAHASVKY